MTTDHTFLVFFGGGVLEIFPGGGETKKSKSVGELGGNCNGNDEIRVGSYETN